MKGFSVMCILWTVLICRIASKVSDLANQKDTSGPQVVEHVVDVIGQSCLLDNSLFLRRMAYVETRDGMDSATYRAGYNGGIWNIDEAMFKQTQNQASLQSEYDDIKRNLFIDWSNVTWADLRAPMKSGLAAALYIRSLNIRSLPDDPMVQATIWGSLRANNQASRFYLEAKDIGTRCLLKEELDMIIAMDFAHLSPLELARLQVFLEAFLKSFRLSQNDTRVGLVTKKLMPKAGWYLNSDRPGFTLLDALKALTYTPGPTFTGDMLEFIRNAMFNSTNGARPTAARAVLFLTDGITQYSYAKDEANNLSEAGISLAIVEVDIFGNSTTNEQLSALTTGLACNSVLVARSFSFLEKNSEEIKTALCNAPVQLKPGNYSYSCSESVHLKVTDPSDTTSIQVLTSSGTVNIFASMTYTRPDMAGHDTMITTTPLSSHVLFMRGLHPIYITIQVANRTATCSDRFEIQVKRAETFTGVNGTCFVGGVVRECSDLDMALAAHDIVLIPDTPAISLCNMASHQVQYFPHATDVHKFIMCDQNNKQYVGLCPVNQTNCVHITSGCSNSNPCSPDAILNNELFFGDPCAVPETYIRCSQFGVADVLRCGDGKLWNQYTKACVFKYVHNVLLSTQVSNIPNPCLYNHEEHAYFPFPQDSGKYIFCDAEGNAFESRCRGGLWNQQTKTCIISPKPTISVG